MFHQETIGVDKIAEETRTFFSTLPDSSVPSVRPVRREFSKRLARVNAQQVIELAPGLLDEPGIRGMAYELVHYHQPALASLDEEALEQFGRGIDGWDAVDPFALYLAGPAWRERQVLDSLIHRWASSQSRWWRRAALVSTVAVALNTTARGGTGDVARTIEVCRVLAGDRDDMVLKALSWALREPVRHDTGAAQQLLDEYDHELAARVKREVRNKLRTGLKNPARD
jgi:3-methyladenine DNA glycosylase AlkD